MRFQILLEAKGLGATLTFVYLFRGMYLEMREEVLFKPALESTERTLISRLVQVLRSV